LEGNRDPFFQMREGVGDELSTLHSLRDWPKYF
jgi:hypothetical protein